MGDLVSATVVCASRSCCFAAGRSGHDYTVARYVPLMLRPIGAAVVRCVPLMLPRSGPLGPRRRYRRSL
jgi:hypothetical protein